MARDHWNDVTLSDERIEELKKECIEIIEAAKPLTFSEAQELRNCKELCDRSHFAGEMKRLCAKTGKPYPKDIDIVLEDPDFDVRLSFITEIQVATDPAPTKKRVRL
jgi:hypothetical protein